MSPVAVPAAPRPTATVIVLAWNRWDLTRQALEALVEHTEAGTYELVIVDNGSTDGTDTGLASLQGATVVRNASNLGFGPAANQAARLARARHLVFLNSDARVHPSWLHRLVEVADADPGVAAVAARLLHEDGRLQEAGAILWREGRVLNYGDGDNPDRPEYRFRRDLDYASAACLLVRRRAFAAVGGFDPRYAPAYLEDVDLCLALAEHGGRVVYQPAATATHARGASSEDRRAVEAQVRRNLPRLRDRWQKVLDRRPPESYYREPSAVVGGRDARCSERLLVVCHRLPSASGGNIERGSLALVQGLRALWPSARLTVAAPGGGDPDAAELLLAAGVEAVWDEPDWDGWLRQRRRHYGAMLLAGPVQPGLVRSLAAWQPQAAVAAVTAWGAPADASRLAAVVGPPPVARTPSVGCGGQTVADWMRALRELAPWLGLVPQPSNSQVQT